MILDPIVPPNAENTTIKPVIGLCNFLGSALSTTELRKFYGMNRPGFSGDLVT